MTDSSDPRAPKSSRKKSSREPATIDLKATVIDTSASPESARDGAKPEDTVSPAETISAGVEPAAEDAVASPQATLDSATGTDSISPQDAPVQDPPLVEPSPEPDRAGPGAGSDDLRAGAPPPPPPERRASSGALIGSGLLGGLVGAGLVYGLQMWQNPGGGAPPSDPRIAQLEQRVSALSRPSTGAQGGSNLQPLEERLAALEGARGAVDQRLQEIQSTAERAAARAEEAANRPQPDAPAPAPQNNAAVDELTSRLSALENQVRTGAQGATEAANAVQGLNGRLTELDQRAAERDRRLTEQDQRLAALSQQQTDLSKQVSDLARQVAEGNKGAQAASQAGIQVVLSERLGDALRNGTPYPEVLEGLRKAAADGARLAPLEPFAQAGAPTASELAQQFEPLGATILRDDRAAAGTWSDRALRMLDRVVTVRPVNEPGSTDVSSLVVRIEQALERGDVADAVAAWEALPEPARRASEEWGQRAKSVAQAQQAAQALGADALAALNRTTQ